MVAFKFIITALFLSQASAAAIGKRSVEVSVSAVTKDGLQFVGEPVLRKPRVNKLVNTDAAHTDVGVDASTNIKKRVDVPEVALPTKEIVSDPVLQIDVEDVNDTLDDGNTADDDVVVTNLARDLLVSDPVLAVRIKSKSSTTMATTTVKPTSTSVATSTVKTTSTTMVTSTTPKASISTAKATSTSKA